MTLEAIATSWVLTLTKVVTAVGGVEKDLDTEYKVGEADIVVGEGGMVSFPRTRSTLEPISQSDITLQISTSGSVLQRSRIFGRTKVNILELPVIIQVIYIQLSN